MHSAPVKQRSALSPNNRLEQNRARPSDIRPLFAIRYSTKLGDKSATCATFRQQKPRHQITPPLGWISMPTIRLLSDTSTVVPMGGQGTDTVSDRIPVNQMRMPDQAFMKDVFT